MVFSIPLFLFSTESEKPPHDANGHSCSSTSPTLSHAVGASTSVQSPPHDASNSLLDDEVQQQEQAPTQPSNSRVTSKSVPYWAVEIIDLEKTTKTIRVKVHKVNYLPLGERIIVHFNEYGSAIGVAQGLLAGYCGTLAVDCNVFPISFERWLGPTGVPKTYKEDCFETFLKPRFCFRTTEATAYRYCTSSIGKKWATHRQRISNEFNDPAKSINELLSNGISKDQWASFVSYRRRA
ncbi:hypothetical protein P3S67_012359 [Capsicum chacoense]